MTEDEERRDKIALERMGHHAGWADYYARQAEQCATDALFWSARILSRRDFETIAEEQLDKAEGALTNALEAVRSARLKYQTLPLSEEVDS